MLSTIGKLRTTLRLHQMLTSAPWRHKIQSCAYTAHSETLQLLEEYLGEFVYILQHCTADVQTVGKQWSVSLLQCQLVAREITSAKPRREAPAPELRVAA